MTSAVLDVQLWMVGLVRASVLAVVEDVIDIDAAKLRVVIHPTSETESPYVYVPPPAEGEDDELSSSSGAIGAEIDPGYAVEVVAEAHFLSEHRMGAEVVEVARLADHVINSAVQRLAAADPPEKISHYDFFSLPYPIPDPLPDPPDGRWNVLRIKLLSHTDLQFDDPNIAVYGRRVAFQLNLTGPVPEVV